jgi:hypothetical protein
VVSCTAFLEYGAEIDTTKSTVAPMGLAMARVRYRETASGVILAEDHRSHEDRHKRQQGPW